MPGIATAFVPLSLTAEFTESQLRFPIIAGGVAAAVFLVAAFLVTRGKWNKDVYVGASWSFTDNWVTNISTLGGVLATVLAAGGFLDAVIPGRDTGWLVGLSILFTAAVLVAPVLYAIFAVWKKMDSATVSATAAQAGKKTLVALPKAWGVIVAAVPTVFGVVGELATLFQVNRVAEGSGFVNSFVDGALIFAACAVFAYAVRFVHGVTAPMDVDSSAVVRTDMTGIL